MPNSREPIISREPISTELYLAQNRVAKTLLLNPSRQSDLDEMLANELGPLGIQSWDAGNNVLSLALRHQSAARHAATILALSPEDFLIPGHQFVWEVVLTLRKEGRSLQMTSVANRMDVLWPGQRNCSWLAYLAEFWQDARRCDRPEDDIEIAVDRLRNFLRQFRAFT